MIKCSCGNPLVSIEAICELCDVPIRRRINCADCGRDVTDQPSHECKEQRKANRKYAKAREAMFAGKDWKPLLPKKEVR